MRDFFQLSLARYVKTSGFTGLALFLAAILSGYLTANPPSASEKDIQSLLSSVKGHSIDQRMDAFSQKFLGEPFEDSPLGEGEKGEYDQNPLARFDKFDCTTFIETVVALALAHQAADFHSYLRHIRYRSGHVSFVTRNHFPCLDWIPNNTANGVVTDVTNHVGEGLGPKVAVTLVDKKSWFENLTIDEIKIDGFSEAQKIKRLEKLHREGKRFEKREAKLPYIPLESLVKRQPLTPAEQKQRLEEEEALEKKIHSENAGSSEADLKTKTHDALVELRTEHIMKDAEVDESILKSIPNGAILNVIRPDWKIRGTALSVTHQGLVFQKGDGAYLRHVSLTGGKRVKDVRLSHYLKLCLLIPSIHGINLLKVNGPPTLH